MSFTRSQAAEELLRRREARRGMLGFTQYTMPGFRPNWHHVYLCSVLDRFIHGDIRRLMIFMPPQHGKSELASRRLPAKIFGHYPDARIIATSYTDDLGTAMNRDVQNVMSTPQYAALFPARLGQSNVRALGRMLPLRNSDEFEIITPEGRLTGGSYKSAGTGGGITGRPMDFGLIDDPVKGRQDAESPAFRKFAWGWYNGDFLSRTHNDTRILITCTRWHPEDLPGMLLKVAADNPDAAQWTVVRLPAIKEDESNPDDPRQVGEALWPDRHSLATLMEKKASSAYDWAGLYQQNPKASGSTEWAEELFGPEIWFDEWPANLVIKVITLDPSKGKNAKTSDYSAYVVFGIDQKGGVWVEADLERRQTKRMVEDGFEIYRKHQGVRAVGVESEQFQELLLDEFARTSKERGLFMPLVGIRTQGISKETRIRRLGPYLGRKEFRFRRTPGTKLLVEQLKQFPTADHDDGPDALEMAVRLARAFLEGQIDQEGIDYVRG